jgi:predicted aspartyl protease
MTMRIGRVLITLMGGGALLSAVLMGACVQNGLGDVAHMPVSIEALFEAAGRGDIAPMSRALATTTNMEVRALLNARLAAARLDPNITNDELVRRLAASGHPALRRAALSVLTDAAFADGDYASAARFAKALEAALAAGGETEQVADAGRTWRPAALLATHPTQDVAGAVVWASIPARTDRVGLPRVDIAVNGVTQDAVFDTGANLSVLSTDTARRMGVTVFKSRAQVGNGVAGTVPVRVGIAARVEIARTTLTNVPFLIIDDADLTFPVPGGYDIREIMGLPVMRALKRLHMESKAGRLTVLPPATTGGAANLHASGNNLFIDVIVGDRPVPLHLDTGANETTLSALYAAVDAEAVARLTTSSTQSASAGGTRQSRIATWTNAPLKLAGRGLVLPALPVTLAGEDRTERYYGSLGSNALQAFKSYTIDFTTMRLELGEPVNPSKPSMCQRCPLPGGSTEKLGVDKAVERAH